MATEKKRKAATGKRTGPAARGRRAPLTREGIVAMALELIEQQGFAAFSTRRLGEALGCEAMSIYHHFPSKQHLLDALVAEVIAGFRWPPPGLDPLEHLRRVCHAYRETAHRYPRFFPYLAVHRLNMPDGVDFIERVLAAFEAVASDRERAARWFRVVGYYLVGAGLDETSGYAAGPAAAEPVSEAYVAAHCPRLAAAAPCFRQPQWDATFDLGLEALIGAMTGSGD
jgi:AcrR family transcriptional regulator